MQDANAAATVLNVQWSFHMDESTRPFQLLLTAWRTTQLVFIAGDAGGLAGGCREVLSRFVCDLRQHLNRSERRKACRLVPEVRVYSGGTAWLGGDDAISVQAEGREDD